MELNLSAQTSDRDNVKLRQYETVLMAEQEVASLRKKMYPFMEERAKKLISSRNLESNLHLTVSKRASGIIRQKASLSLSKQRASSNMKPLIGEDFTMKDSEGKLLTTELNLQMMLGNDQDFLDSEIQIDSNYAST